MSSQQASAQPGRERISLRMWEDFRASVHPDTAARRFEYFKNVLAGIESDDLRRELSGADPDYSGSPYAFKRVVEAHIDFAKAQIKESAARDSVTASQPLTEGATQ